MTEGKRRGMGRHWHGRLRDIRGLEVVWLVLYVTPWQLCRSWKVDPGSSMLWDVVWVLQRRPKLRFAKSWPLPLGRLCGLPLYTLGRVAYEVLVVLFPVSVSSGRCRNVDGC